MLFLSFRAMTVSLTGLNLLSSYFSALLSRISRLSPATEALIHKGHPGYQSDRQWLFTAAQKWLTMRHNHVYYYITDSVLVRRCRRLSRKNRSARSEESAATKMESDMEDMGPSLTRDSSSVRQGSDIAHIADKEASFLREVKLGSTDHN